MLALTFGTPLVLLFSGINYWRQGRAGADVRTLEKTVQWLDALGYDCFYQSKPAAKSKKVLKHVTAAYGIPMEKALAFRHSNLSLVPISGGCWRSDYEFHRWSNVACFLRGEWERTVVENYVVRDP